MKEQWKAVWDGIDIIIVLFVALFTIGACVIAAQNYSPIYWITAIINVCVYAPVLYKMWKKKMKKNEEE